MNKLTSSAHPNDHYVVVTFLSGNQEVWSKKFLKEVNHKNTGVAETMTTIFLKVQYKLKALCDQKTRRYYTLLTPLKTIFCREQSRYIVRIGPVPRELSITQEFQKYHYKPSPFMIDGTKL